MTIRGGSWPGPLPCAPCGSGWDSSWADTQVCPYVGVHLEFAEWMRAGLDGRRGAGRKAP